MMNAKHKSNIVFIVLTILQRSNLINDHKISFPIGEFLERSRQPRLFITMSEMLSPVNVDKGPSLDFTKLDKMINITG